MEKIFKISKATAERDLALLKKLGLIEFIGPPKTGKYMLTKKGSDLLDAMEIKKWKILQKMKDFQKEI